jgi:hypothetical protein
MHHRLHHLEGVEKVQFLPRHGPLKATKAIESLSTKALNGDHFPTETAGHDFGSRKQ